MPTALVSFPFETFMGAVGLVCAWPTAVRLDGSDNVYVWFPDWVPYVWTALMVIGGVRALYGVCVNRRSHMATGSLLVSLMVVVIGLASIYHTDGVSGWTTTLMGSAMVIVAGLRSLYLSAVAAELREVE